MSSTWVVVADDAKARVLRCNGAERSLEPVVALGHPDSLGPEAKRRRDAVGRRSGGNDDPHANVGHATASAGEDQQHRESQRFAAQVAELLEDGFRKQQYSALTLVAAPRFLGLLRKALSPAVQGCVSRSLDKELLQLTDGDIAESLQLHHQQRRQRADAGNGRGSAQPS